MVATPHPAARAGAAEARLTINRLDDARRAALAWEGPAQIGTRGDGRPSGDKTQLAGWVNW